MVVRPQNPLRVCMLVHGIYERDARVRRYAEYLADDGHSVDVICLQSENGKTKTGHGKIRVFPINMRRKRRTGIRHVLEWGLSAVMMFSRLSGLDRRVHYDVIHAHNMPDFIVFCALIPRLRGCPVILDIHDPMPELARCKLGLKESDPVIRGQVMLEAVAIKFSSHVITATPAFRDALVRRGAPEEKVTVVINAADPKLFAAGEYAADSRGGKPEAFTLLYVGTVAARYGLDVLVRALALIRHGIPGVKIRILTKLRDEGADLDETLALSSRLGVRDLIEVDGPVPLEEMPAIMAEADLGVYPALSDCHMDLALSLKIPEMVNVGLPILATRLPVLESMYGDDCMSFFSSGDHRACADKILELYRCPDLRRRLALNALRKSAHLTWESQYAAYKCVLCEVLGRDPDL